MKNGDRVRVVRNTDETCPRRFVGRVGYITGSKSGANVGGGVRDRLYTVAFKRGGSFSFWSEELEAI